MIDIVVALYTARLMTIEVCKDMEAWIPDIPLFLSCERLLGDMSIHVVRSVFHLH